MGSGSTWLGSQSSATATITCSMDGIVDRSISTAARFGFSMEMRGCERD